MNVRLEANVFPFHLHSMLIDLERVMRYPRMEHSLSPPSGLDSRLFGEKYWGVKLSDEIFIVVYF